MFNLLPGVLGAPTLEHATDWNATAWTIWWSLTAVAVVLYLVGVNATSAYSSRIPGGLGMVMAVAGYVFLFVAVAQMLTHSPDGKLIGIILLVFLVIAGVTGIAAAMALGGGRARLGWITVGLLGVWTVFGAIGESVTRIGLAVGIAPFGVIALIALGCLVFFSSAQRR